MDPLGNIVGPIVINLSKRKDRWEKICRQAEDLDLPVERLGGILKKDSAAGCLASHIKAVRCGIRHKKPVWICEDDCKYLVDKATLVNIIQEFMNSSAEVLCLGYNDFRHESFSESELLYRTFDCQAASSYIVKTSIQQKLVNLWNSVLHYRRLKMRGIPHPLESEYMNLNIHNPEFLRRDQSWKIL